MFRLLLTEIYFLTFETHHEIEKTSFGCLNSLTSKNMSQKNVEDD